MEFQLYHTYADELQQRPVFQVLHDNELWTSVARDNAVQIDHVDVIELPHHRRRHEEVQSISLRRRIAQRFHGNGGRRAPAHRQVPVADVSELTCSKVSSGESSTG